MSHLPDHVREALGLAVDDPIEVRGSASHPGARVAHGYAATGAEVPSLETILRERVPSAPHTTEVDALAPFTASLGIEGVAVEQWDADPGVVFMTEPPSGMRIAGKHHRHEDGSVAIDCRNEPAFVRLEGERGDALLELRSEMIRWFDICPRPTPEMARLAEWTPPPATELAPPDVDSLLGGLPVEPWLLDEVRPMLASGSPLAIAAGVGLVARLWSPPPGADKRAAMERVLRGDGPRARAAAWFASIGDRARGTVARDLAREADTLAEQLAHLEGAVAADPPGTRAAALAWLHRRDDLQSVVALLRAAGRDEAVERALARLDREASAHHSMWSALESFSDDPRLSAVAWQEPDPWWSALAS